jgi:hypothetical protein
VQCRAEGHRWASRIASGTIYILKQVFTTRKTLSLPKSLKGSLKSYKLELYKMSLP